MRVRLKEFFHSGGLLSDTLGILASIVLLLLFTLFFFLLFQLLFQHLIPTLIPRSWLEKSDDEVVRVSSVEKKVVPGILIPEDRKELDRILGEIPDPPDPNRSSPPSSPSWKDKDSEWKEFPRTGKAVWLGFLRNPFQVSLDKLFRNKLLNPRDAYIPKDVRDPLKNYAEAAVRAATAAARLRSRHALKVGIERAKRGEGVEVSEQGLDPDLWPLYKAHLQAATKVFSSEEKARRVALSEVLSQRYKRIGYMTYSGKLYLLTEDMSPEFSMAMDFLSAEVVGVVKSWFISLGLTSESFLASSSRRRR